MLFRSRAKELVKRGIPVFSTPSLQAFLVKDYHLEDFLLNPGLLDIFANLDDSDISVSVKQWSIHPDSILADLSQRLLNRKLFKILMQKEPFSPDFLSRKMELIRQHYVFNDERDLDYYFVKGKVINNAYNTLHDRIYILQKDG